AAHCAIQVLPTCYLADAAGFTSSLRLAPIEFGKVGSRRGITMHVYRDGERAFSSAVIFGSREPRNAQPLVVHFEVGDLNFTLHAEKSALGLESTTRHVGENALTPFNRTVPGESRLPLRGIRHFACTRVKKVYLNIGVVLLLEDSQFFCTKL